MVVIPSLKAHLASLLLLLWISTRSKFKGSTTVSLKEACKQFASKHPSYTSLNSLCRCVCRAEVDVGKDEEFTINTRGAGGQGKVDVKITSPSRRPIPCKVESGTANEVHSVKYIPPEEGPYKIDISYDGNPVPGSPFTVEGVMPPDPSKVRGTKRRM